MRVSSKRQRRTGVARGGPERSRPQRMRKNIKASFVNLALNMRYKYDKKYQICHTHIRLFKLKMHQNPFSAGAPPRRPYTPPDPLLGWGGDTLSLFPSTFDASASRTRRLRRLGSQAPSTQNPGYASAASVSPAAYALYVSRTLQMSSSSSSSLSTIPFVSGFFLSLALTRRLTYWNLRSGTRIAVDRECMLRTASTRDTPSLRWFITAGARSHPFDPLLSHTQSTAASHRNSTSLHSLYEISLSHLSFTICVGGFPHLKWDDAMRRTYRVISNELDCLMEVSTRSKLILS